MARPIRVALVGPMPPPFGGMANQTRQLARLLRHEGIEVGVVPTNAPCRPQFIERVRGLRAGFRLVPYLGALWREVRQSSVVHVMANSGLAWYLLAAPAIHVAVAMRRPVIINYRGGLASEFLNKSASRVLPTLRKASAVVVPSGFLKRVFADHGVQTLIIPNVIDTTVFHPADPPRTRTDGLHLVIARNIEVIYGIDLAIRALAMLKTQGVAANMSIAGVGPERAALGRLAAELGVTDEARFLGRLDIAAMADLYRRADVVVNPSRVDNMPNSILEALASGVPVVSTDVGGIPHLVKHAETAWLVPPESPDQLAAGVRAVLEAPQVRERLSRNGLALARRYAWAEVRRSWLQLYDRAITGHRDSPEAPLA